MPLSPCFNFLPVDSSYVVNAESTNSFSLSVAFLRMSFAKLKLLLRFLEPMLIPSVLDNRMAVNKDFVRYDPGCDAVC